MENIEISPEEMLQAYQQTAATEASKLYGEIAYRDALIKQLVQKLNDLNKEQNGA